MTDCSFTNIQAEIKKPSCLLRIELGAAAQDLIYLLNIHYCSFFVDSSHPTPCVCVAPCGYAPHGPAGYCVSTVMRAGGGIGHHPGVLPGRDNTTCRNQLQATQPA